VGGFVAFITAMLMLVAPVKHLSDVMAPITRGLAAVERGIDLIEPARPRWAAPRMRPGRAPTARSGRCS
jgi:ABC-type multidrug transport system fused ATPase/permease subunit